MRYVIKRLKNIKSFLFLFDFINGTSNSILPASFRLSCFFILPLLSIIALIPLFAERKTKVLFSIALKIVLAKCWLGPIVSPNQPSSDIFTIKLVLSLEFWIKSVKIIS